MDSSPVTHLKLSDTFPTLRFSSVIQLILAPSPSNCGIHNIAEERLKVKRMIKGWGKYTIHSQQLNLFLTSHVFSIHSSSHYSIIVLLFDAYLLTTTINTCFINNILLHLIVVQNTKQNILNKRNGNLLSTLMM